MVDDASATYRGFRNQALYVLARVLEDAQNTRIFVPEGAEDLAVYDTELRLVEAVQVKDLTGRLTLSDLKPRSPDGFIARMAHRLAHSPACQNKLASFGELGPELQGALQRQDPGRSAVLRKLVDQASLDQTAAANLLDRLAQGIERPNHVALAQALRERLNNTVVQGDVETAIDLLTFWVFRASEERRSLTHDSLVYQLENVGAFLALLRDASAEWMATVVPVRDVALDKETRAELVAQYRNGVHASWEHILADADVRRVRWTRSIHEQFAQHGVVLLRGASGQGKSTIGWRYLSDYYADGLRFHVRVVDGRVHASRVAQLLRSHIHQLQLDAIVYVDVRPQDTGWLELIRQLSDARIRVLVTAREEDVRRAGEAHRELDIGEVFLNSFGREEAEELYSRMVAREPHTKFLDFDEAWARFSSVGPGALLEFAYLVLEGETLQHRIEAQLNRLRDDTLSSATPGKEATLRALTLCAIAHAADARASYSRVLSLLELEPLSEPFRILEEEFFLRREEVDGEVLLAPLHPIRASIVSGVMRRTAAEAWKRHLLCAPSVVWDDDVGQFLRHSLLSTPEHASSILQVIGETPPPSWSYAAGVLQALLWYDLSIYENNHSRTLADAIATCGSAWILLGNTFATIPAASIRETLAEASGQEIPEVELPPVESALRTAKEWTASVPVPTAPPSRLEDWEGAGFVAFLCGTLGNSGALVDCVGRLLPEPSEDFLPLDTLGRVVSGLHRLRAKELCEWCTRHERIIRQRFLNETNSINLEDDQTTVRVVYPLPPLAAGEMKLNEESMRRIDRLRQLVPDRETYAAQALGMEMFESLVGFDESKKNIKRENLFDQRMVFLNATLIALVAYRHQRPADWDDYVETIVAMRRSLAEYLRRLLRFWVKLQTESQLKPKTLKRFPIRVTRTGARLEVPMLPQIAVDPYGFASEARETEALGLPGARQTDLTLRRYSDWKKYVAGYLSHLETVVKHAESASIAYVKRRWRVGEISEAERKSEHLVLINLDGAWDSDELMRSEFRRLFGDRVDAHELRTLEGYETGLVRDLWTVSFDMVNGEARKRKNPLAQLAAKSNASERMFKEAFLNAAMEVSTGSREPYIAEASLEGSNALWMVCNHGEMPKETVRRRTLEVAWSKLHEREWEHLSWTPITKKWKHVVVVHQVRGRLVSPVACRIPTPLLFSDRFEMSEGLFMELPVAVSVLQQIGVKLWTSPLVRVAAEWSKCLLEFALVLTQWRIVDEYVEQSGIPDDIGTTSTAQADNELHTSYHQLAARMTDLKGVLLAAAKSEKGDDEASNWLARLDWSPSEEEAESLLLPRCLAESINEPEEWPALVDELLRFVLSRST